MMPQGEGTYGSEVGRPSKKDKNKSSGSMDDMYGVGQDIDKMNTSNAQDRVQKYALGGPVYGNFFTDVEGHGQVRPWDLKEGTDVYEELMTRNERTVDVAEDKYQQGLYGGTTSYDMATQVDSEKGDEFAASGTPSEEDPGDPDITGPDYPNPFNSPGQTSVGGGPEDDERDVQLREGGGIKQKLGWDRGSGRRLAEGGEIPNTDVQIYGSTGDIEFGPGGPGGYAEGAPGVDTSPQGAVTDKDSLITGEGKRDVDLEGRNVYAGGGTVDARNRSKTESISEPDTSNTYNPIDEARRAGLASPTWIMNEGLANMDFRQGGKLKKGAK